MKWLSPVAARAPFRCAALVVATVAIGGFPAHAQVEGQAGGAPAAPAGTLGQRQAREQVNANGKPLRRIDSRIQSRVATRIQSRVDRNYDGDPNAAERIGQAGVRASNTSQPR